MHMLDGHAPTPAVEGKHTPRMRTTGARGLRERTVRVLGDDAAPEMTTAMVSFGDADDPANGKAIP